MDWLQRNSDVEQTPDGKFVFYHGTPKVGGATNALRAGSLLETDPKKAAYYASHNRGIPAKAVKVIRLELDPQEINPGGVWASLRNDKKDEQSSNLFRVRRPGSNDV